MNSTVLFSRESENGDYECGEEKRLLTTGDIFDSPGYYESCLSIDTTEVGGSVYQTKSSFLPNPLPSLTTNRDDRLLWTKPKLLRKKEAELSRCRELLSKKVVDCANALSGERFAVERQAELKRKLCSQRNEFEMMKRIERLRNRERLVSETEKLRRERDEAEITSSSKDLLVKRLRVRVRQLELMEKQKEAEIAQMKRDLDSKNAMLKNLLRKLVLAQFTKKKS